MTTLESLARTICSARHGTDAMWANYMGAAEAAEKMMSETTEAPETSETPSGHLRWRRGDDYGGPPVLQALWYLTTYRGLEVSQTEVWRDVPVVGEE